MANGARGVISVTANVVPEAMAQLMAAALRGEREARAAARRAAAGAARGAVRRGQSDSGQVGHGERGLIEGGLRLPLTELSEAFHARVRAALEAAEGLAPLTQAKSA